MQATLAELAALVDGHVLGDGDLVIRGAAIIRDARPGEITLIDKPELTGSLKASGASAAVAEAVAEHVAAYCAAYEVDPAAR